MDFTPISFNNSIVKTKVISDPKSKKVNEYMSRSIKASRYFVSRRLKEQFKNKMHVCLLGFLSLLFL